MADATWNEITFPNVLRPIRLGSWEARRQYWGLPEQNGLVQRKVGENGRAIAFQGFVQGDDAATAKTTRAALLAASQEEDALTLSLDSIDYEYCICEAVIVDDVPVYNAASTKYEFQYLAQFRQMARNSS